MKKQLNDLAHPVIEQIRTETYAHDATSTYYVQGGLTKREHIAALAMQGYVVAQRGHLQEMAEAAVMAADALLKELNKEV